MEFKEFANEFSRMCNKNKICRYCCMSIHNNGYNISCTNYITKYPAEAEEKLKTWISENPRKTILQDFLEKFPNAKLYHEGTPGFCPKDLDCDYKECTTFNADCEGCWNQEI